MMNYTKMSHIQVSQKFYSPAKAESDQKDIIIAQLKADIFELRKAEEDFYILQDELRKMELKIKLLLDERNMQDSEFKQRHEHALKQISQLGLEIDQLRKQIRSRDQELETLKQEILQLSELCDLRTIDIQNAKRDFNKSKDELHQEQDLNERLKDQNAAFEDEARAMLARNNDIKRGIDDISRKIQEKNRILQRIEDDLKKAEKANLMANQDYEELQNQLQRSNQDLKQTENMNVDTAKQIKALEAKLMKLRQDADNTQVDAQRHHKSFLLEQGRNQDLALRLGQLESYNQQRDDQINDFEKELTILIGENDNIKKTNGTMKDDLDGLKKHIDILFQENQQLVVELESYCDDDEKVKAILNRRQRVRELSKRVEISFRGQIKQSPVKSQPTQKQSYNPQGSGQKQQKRAFQ